MVAFQILTAAMVSALLVAEYRNNQVAKWFSKPLASLGFIGVAWTAGAWDSDYGRLVLLALVLCWAGDVLLIPVGNDRVFRAGILSFLSGHLAFAAAFLARGVDPSWGGVALLALTVPAVLVLRWLKPGLPAGMRLPVYAYIVVISLMVVLSLATYGHRPEPLIPLGAALFYLSDISVARDRFLSPGFGNRLWGLPAYYGAQLLLAYTVGTG